MVEAMLDLVKAETERIDARFLTACGSGNFIVQITTAQARCCGNEIRRRSVLSGGISQLLGLMCIYGIELLEDNIAECRANVLEVFAEYLQLDESHDLYGVAAEVLVQNIIHGDALTMRTHTGQRITFPEWGYCGKANLPAT